MELIQTGHRLGYKQTEVGWIPKDWQITELSRVIHSLSAGVSVNSIEGYTYSITSDSKYVLKTSSVQRGVFIPTESKKVAQFDTRRARLNPTKNSLLISRMNTPDLVGQCAYVPNDFLNLYVPDRLWLTSFFPDKPTNALWMNYLLSNSFYQDRIKSIATGTSGSMKNISKRAFLSIVIPLPTFAEQKAIATALFEVDALLQSLDRLIVKKKALKQGAMQELLTGRKRLEGFETEKGFQHTELGPIPIDWELIPISDFTVEGGLIRGPFGGVLKKEIFVKNGYKVYEQKNAIHQDVTIGRYYELAPKNWTVS
ncbi:restriction endonuclease subunit S [Pontibacter sp. G13]|uniref:restriction endonuclease subunit S n=1 Tax=Pontibacter sp. G13 TaxID=3074898 RepID=UPI00288C26F5|nr:restriction endonuclease subunit S [Pontibacter sp. G13]WNJ17575.1 restriction endonuclease subunit S [Pontibacter sp. G13]